MQTIKYQAGDEVYWLSSAGYRKGVVKTITFRDEVVIFNKKRSTSLKYYLWCENYRGEYQGDEVREDKVFSTYEEMLAHYANQPI